MKNLKWSPILLLLAMAVLLIGGLCGAQTTVPQSLLYAWPNPTGTGQIGSYLVFGGSGQGQPIPSNYTIDWSDTGTAPSVCTFRVEGSYDGVTWFGLDTTSPAATSCTASNMESIAYKPVHYLRIDVVSWTPGDGTTQVIFHYTGRHK